MRTSSGFGGVSCGGNLDDSEHRKACLLCQGVWGREQRQLRREHRKHLRREQRNHRRPWKLPYWWRPGSREMRLYRESSVLGMWTGVIMAGGLAITAAGAPAAGIPMLVVAVLIGLFVLVLTGGDR